MTGGHRYEHVPQELLARLFQRKVIPLLGAGCSASAPSRIPSAPHLAQLLIDRGAGSEGQSLEDIAEEAWARGDWQAFAQLLPIDEWRARPPNIVTRVLAELCKETLIAQILTTNWDVLIESALSQIGQPFSKVVDADSLAIEPAGRVTLIKLNGCIEHPRFIKATRTQIQSPEWLDAWINALFDVIVRSNSMLFAGYSGASRAATTTMARLVDASERHATDFLVDRLRPDQIAESSGSGERFIAAINLAAPFTGEASDFFTALRADVYPLLLAEPATCARSMTAELVAPTAVAEDQLISAINEIVDMFKAVGATECQRWLLSCFASFPDLEHTAPYLPLLPNASDLGKCMLFLATTRWVERLETSAQLDFTLVALIGDVSTRLPYGLIACHPQHRRDVAARAAVAEFAREHRETPAGAAIGVAFGGIGGVDGAMTSFSVTRGRQTGSAARGTGATVAWIDGDALLAEFRENADDVAIKDQIRRRIDEAAARAFGGRAG
jgi:hypothetical protein